MKPLKMLILQLYTGLLPLLFMLILGISLASGIAFMHPGHHKQRHQPAIFPVTKVQRPAPAPSRSLTENLRRKLNLLLSHSRSR